MKGNENMTKVGFIGAGNMGGALARAASRAESTKVYVYDLDKAKAEMLASDVGGEYLSANGIAEICDYIFLAVKPNVIRAAVKPILGTLRARTDYTVVSMAAGVSLEALEGCLDGANAAIIRIMPNTPAAYGKGMMLWCRNSKR